MKEDHAHNNSHLFPRHKKRILKKIATFFLLFSLGYTFGFLSASTSSSSKPPIPSTNPSSSSSDTQFTHQIPTITTATKRNSVRGVDGGSCNREAEEEETPTLPLPPPPPTHDLFQFRTQCAPPLSMSEILPTLLDRIYNGTSPYAGFPPPHAAHLLRPRRVRGWGSTAPVFQTLIEAVKPRTIVEVGTFLGASALHMANLTSDLGTLILCLDDFRGWPGFRRLPPPKRDMFRDIADVNGDVTLMYQFMQNVAAAGEERRVLPVPFSTGSGLAALCEWGVYGDLVEVDAGHDFHSAWQDINMAWAVLRPGGVMFGHDYHLAAGNRGVRRAVDLFARSKGLRVKPNGQHWVLFPSKPHKVN